MTKRILLYEYVTGGGLINEAFRSNLYNEAKIMLTSMLKDSEDCSKISYHFFCDHRMNLSFKSNAIKIEKKNQKKIYNKRLIKSFDYVIPILPESKKTLYSYVKFLNNNNIKSIISTPKTISNISDKWLFYKICINYKIKTIPTYLDTKILKGKVIVKDRFGEGCSYIKLYRNIKYIINNRYDQNKIIQPYIEGQNLSLSVFFNNNSFYLLSVNKQNIFLNKDNYLKLKSILVNVTISFEEKIYSLIEKIYNAFPGLYGYVGIDILIKNNNIFVVEINPRLTTSFAGIKYTKGINLLDLFLKYESYKDVISGRKVLIKI